MPENFFKIYPPKKAPSEDDRRGSGLWSGDTPKERFKHVKIILDLYFNYKDLLDDLDLTWFLKNAVIGNIYFSKKVVEGINKKVYWPHPQSETINTVINNILKCSTYKNETFDESLLQVRKWLGKDFHKKEASPLRFEHVIPAKVYLSELKKLYLNTNHFENNDSLSRFNEYRKKVAVCIITKAEDDALNKAGLRESMPDDWKWGGDIFARYVSLTPKIEVEGIP